MEVVSVILEESGYLEVDILKKEIIEIYRKEKFMFNKN